ncbi:hypothetical protein Ahy_A03g015541 [Arachis hypogaea]|uniref:Uncharacterized protein n=1 Tax=Arachis hypogaea TaxID=3818 RepID=A0A445E0N8_ARAHY|nr:hypothetical protein Ahy_A03g015541 [Arachis hypogaea]
MMIGRGAADQAASRGRSHGRGRGRVSFGTLGTSGPSPSTLTTLVTPQVAGLAEQPFIMVPNPNYVSSSTATTFLPIVQQPASTAMPSPTTDATVSESNHVSDATVDAPPPPTITRLRIWPNGGMGFLPNLNTFSILYLYCLTEFKTSLLQLYFIWDAEHNLVIRKIFDYRMGRRLQQMLDDVRKGQDQQMCWLRPEVKKGLFAHWENDAGFRHRRLTNQANRASERSPKYTRSSATFMKTKVRLSKSLDCETTLAETFKYTHTLKENKVRFVDERSQDHYRLEAATQQSQQSEEDAVDGVAASVVDPDAV